ncbi:MAG TPA: 16S rRNA (guanine(527)-N(7))-methyltransferase RsmG [candidate division Zixibacteria bacterium]|nr:16S rRNA (guanine(527)-N(7))-methyltransferase RsmG [candidate division Zixibacteria bacterium]
MNRVIFSDILKRLDFDVPEESIDTFAKYVDLLRKSSLSLNLLSSGEVGHIWERHILDSLWPIILGVFKPNSSILDVGTGAGLPGIPLAICSPSLKVVMVESVGKKARFIERAVSSLSINNSSVVNTRIEDYRPEILFDYCTSRAFASIEKSLPLFTPFVEPSGEIIFYKGPDSLREISDARHLLPSLNLSSPEIIKIPSFSPSKGFNLVVYKRR